MTTEKFDLVVKFENSSKKGENGNGNIKIEEIPDELLGIEEIEFALNGKDPELYIKESELFNVVLVELGTDSLEAAKQLKKSNPQIISRVVPISKVVKTDLLEIVNSLKVLASDKMDPGDNFTFDSFVVTQKNIESNDILKRVEKELKKFGMYLDESNPKWKIYVEVIGENTGLNILKTKTSQICISNSK